MAGTTTTPAPAGTPTVTPPSPPPAAPTSSGTRANRAIRPEIRANSPLALLNVPQTRV